MAYLVRIDPARNERRFYMVVIQPTFLGAWCVVRVHGRIDASSRTLPPIECPSPEAAQSLADFFIGWKLRRGYTLTAGREPPNWRPHRRRGSVK